MEGGKGEVPQLSKPAKRGKEGGPESKATSRLSTWVRSPTQGAELVRRRGPGSGGPDAAATGLSTRGRSVLLCIYSSFSKAKMWIFTVPELVALELRFHSLQSSFNVILQFQAHLQQLTFLS